MPDNCPVCSSKLRQSSNSSSGSSVSSFDCPQCGEFLLEESATKYSEFRDSRQLISAWLRLQNKRGERKFLIDGDFITRDWFKNLPNVGFPQTVNEKLDGLLKAYAYISKDDYSMNIGVNQHHELVSEIAAKDLKEIKALNRLLFELGYQSNSIGKFDEDSVRLKAAGWLRIDELNKSISTSDSAFIAMWFDKQTDGFREVAREAITVCGYKPVIIDDRDYNGFIMDEVIVLIRQARFLIADLTCIPEKQCITKVTGGVRGGVYWEAGMAYGLGKTVIQTCKETEESKERIHFDLGQYRTIFWKEDELTVGNIDLANPVKNPTFGQKLAQHIMATVGKGSYKSPS